MQGTLSNIHMTYHNRNLRFVLLGFLLTFALGCNQNNTHKPKEEAPEGMVWIADGSFMMGAVPGDQHAMSHEYPAQQKTVKGFYMDMAPVTNKENSIFVEATGYDTLEERRPDWEELKKQLPPGTQRPPDSLMQAGSLVFKKVTNPVTNFHDVSQWWEWVIGADWKHPFGPNSNLVGKEQHPVVHVAYEDALAYCQWAGKRLPTEVEWEFAARGSNEATIYFWGNDVSQLSKYANTWEGNFPLDNSKEDGYEHSAPVKSYPPNSNGLYDMAGNVWELTSTPFEQNRQETVIKGGSFLCHASYCANFRLSARMGATYDSSTNHIGFRTVKDTP